MKQNETNKEHKYRYKMKIAIIIGTRPEIIKMAPIIRECEMTWKNPFGDGKAGERIVDIISKK